MCAEHVHDNELVDAIISTLTLNWVNNTRKICDRIVLNNVVDPDPRKCIKLVDAMEDIKVFTISLQYSFVIIRELRVN